MEPIDRVTGLPKLGAVDWLIADHSRALTLLSAFRKRSQIDIAAVPGLTAGRALRHVNGGGPATGAGHQTSR